MSSDHNPMVSEFLLSLGFVIGSLARTQVRDFLHARRISDAEMEQARELLIKLASPPKPLQGKDGTILP